ncbi:hypothetical protein Q9L58_004631 [Maublancomyces gigas]|uniref:Uncharacterized protein n=1 Tax=Discina gigas TaxID=1032678 RepID=A0ABR3GKB8_9PEZI
MGTRGLVVYRVRAWYYITYNHHDSDPPDLGTRLVAEIPSDPAKFQEWKRAKISHYRSEETRILRLTRQLEDPLKVIKDVSLCSYEQMPCRLCPKLYLYIEWIYFIDLDQNVFRVYARDDPYTGLLRNSVFSPRQHSSIAVYPTIMTSPKTLPGEHWANYLREISTPDPMALELYQTISLGLEDWVPIPAHVPTWRRLQAQLLEQFVDTSIHNKKSQPSPTIQAAIAKAVRLASAADSSSDVTAVIFSICCIVIVNIKLSPHGPEAPHSPNIPLFSFRDVDDAFASEDMRILRETQYLTLGVRILLDVFSAHPVHPKFPSG